jgi:hypothetical protein
MANLRARGNPPSLPLTGNQRTVVLVGGYMLLGM